MKKTFVLTNHCTLQEQVDDLKNNWGVEEVVELPPDLKELWGTVPPEAECVCGYVQPVIDWLATNCAAGDLVWVQGEWGATAEALLWCARHGFVSIYGTTGRVATETLTENGTVMTHVFKHVRFRKFPF